MLNIFTAKIIKKESRDDNEKIKIVFRKIEKTYLTFIYFYKLLV